MTPLTSIYEPTASLWAMDSAALVQPAYGERLARPISPDRALRTAYAAAILVLLVWSTSFVMGFRWAIAALTVLGFLGILGGVFRPSLGLMAVGLMCAIDPLTRVYLMTGGLLRWNTFNYFLLFSSLMGLPLLLTRLETHGKILAAFAVYLTIGLAVSADRRTGVLTILNLSAFFGLWVYFRRAVSDPMNFVGAAIVVGAATVGGGFAFFMLRHTVERIDENSLSHGFLTAQFVICLASTWPMRRQDRIVLGALFAANVCFVFLTGSRGGMLVSTACTLFFLSRLPGYRTKIQLAALSAFIVLIVLWQFPDLKERSLHRIDKMLDQKRSITSRTHGRYELAMGAWIIFSENPLGIGTGGFAVTRASMAERGGVFKVFGGEEYAAHSGWMKVLAENGVPGILLLGTFVFSFVGLGWVRWREGLLPIGTLATTTIGLMFVTTEFQSKGLWMIAAGASVVMESQFARRRASQPPTDWYSAPNEIVALGDRKPLPEGELRLDAAAVPPQPRES